MTEQVKTVKNKYRFQSSGNLTIVLSPSRSEPIVNALGQIIGSKKVKALKAVFNDGFFQTDNEDIVQLIQTTANWTNDVYWDPTSVPVETGSEGKEIAKKVSNSRRASIKRREKGIEAALEGNIPTDRT